MYNNNIDITIFYYELVLMNLLKIYNPTHDYKKQNNFNYTHNPLHLFNHPKIPKNLNVNQPNPPRIQLIAPQNVPFESYEFLITQRGIIWYRQWI